MKLPIILITVFCIFVDFSYPETVNKCNNPCRNLKPCESLDFSHEASKIPKIDFAKHSVIANYCLHHDSRKDSVWELLLYERIVSPTLEIQKECRGYSISGAINLEAREIFQSKSSGTSGGCIKTCIGSKEACANNDDKCEINIEKERYIYHNINNFYINYCFRNIDIEKISLLFDMYLPIKWKLKISCDGEKIPIPAPENYYIYISGVCNEEQLRKIDENKKI